MILNGARAIHSVLEDKGENARPTVLSQATIQGFFVAGAVCVAVVPKLSHSSRNLGRGGAPRPVVIFESAFCVRFILIDEGKLADTLKKNKTYFVGCSTTLQPLATTRTYVLLSFTNAFIGYISITWAIPTAAGSPILGLAGQLLDRNGAPRLGMARRGAASIFPSLISEGENAFGRFIHSSSVGRHVIKFCPTLSRIRLGTIAIGHFHGGVIGRVGHGALAVASCLDSGAF